MSSVWLGWASYLGSLHDANRSCSMQIFLAAAALWRRGGRYGSKGGCYRRDRQTDGHEISAGIIQGSGIGPASYVVNSSDLTAVRPGNLLCKYADDTYLIIPPINVDTRLDELANVEEWSRKNNLTLNRSKSQEIIFIDRRRKRNIQHPPPLPDISRVSSIKILGVTVSGSLSVCVDMFITSSHLARKAFWPCEYFGHTAWQPPASTIHVIFNAVVIAKLTYAASRGVAKGGPGTPIQSY